MKSIVLSKQNKLRGAVTLAGDKSLAHRAVMFASLANGKSVLRNFPNSEDCQGTMRLFKHLGVQIKKISNGHYVVYGRGINGLNRKKDLGELYCGNSGTTMRLMTGILSGLNISCELTGDKSLMKRPMGRVVKPLKLMGAKLNVKGQKGLPPIIIRGANLKPCKYKLPMPSAQVKSCILLAGLHCDGQTVVLEPKKSRDHTERLLRYLKVPIQRNKHQIKLRGGVEPQALQWNIPGDISSAAFLIAMAVLVPGSKLRLKKVLWNSLRLGFVYAAKRMGAHLKIARVDAKGSESVANIDASFSELKAITVKSLDIPSMIDELPILMVMATQAQGKSWFHGIGELRVKETDRVSSMVNQLRSMGASIGVRGDSIWVQGKTPLKGRVIQSFGDHRTAFSFIVAGMIAQGQTKVRGVDCIKTSFPDYIQILRASGCRFKAVMDRVRHEQKGAR